MLDLPLRRQVALVVGAGLVPELASAQDGAMSQPSPEVGVAVLAVQMTEVIKDVTDLRVELKEHRREHAEESARRVSARWKLALLFGGLFAGVEAPLIALLLRH
jgi:hypothetical protein